MDEEKIILQDVNDLLVFITVSGHVRNFHDFFFLDYLLIILSLIFKYFLIKQHIFTTYEYILLKSPSKFFRIIPPPPLWAVT